MQEPNVKQYKVANRLNICFEKNKGAVNISFFFFFFFALGQVIFGTS